MASRHREKAPNSASPSSAVTRHSCGRLIRGLSNYYQHATRYTLNNAYFKKLLIIIIITIIILAFFTRSESLKNKKKIILKATTKPKATANNKPTIPWDTLEDLFSDEENNSTYDQNNNLSESIDQLHLVLCILISSLFSAIYCIHENYWLSMTDLKNWSTMMTSCFMAASLILQIFNELSPYGFIKDIISVLDAMEFMSTSILLCINYARTSFFTADTFILNQDYIGSKRICYIGICILGTHLKIRELSAGFNLMINLIELVVKIHSNGISINIIKSNIYNAFIANYMYILKIRVIVYPLLPLFFELDENFVSFLGVLNITRGIFYCNSNLYKIIGENNDLSLLA